jgi:hypothetical protein
MKTKQTKIPVEIATEYTHEIGNELEFARQQIELSSFYLQSLFNSIKHSAAQLETEVDEKQKETCSDLMSLSEIGYAVSNSVFAAVSHFETSENKTETNDATQTALSVAEMLSFLINDESVPEYISDGISQVMTDFFNDEVDQTEFIKETHSPRYIARLLQNQKGDELKKL